MENLNAKDSIRTYSGQYVNLINPDPDTILIEDIAHALSCVPRWAGHLPTVYSVAQHSVACYRLVEEEFKLEALLHDATEAYLGDVPKPLKNNLPDYQAIEKNMYRVIAEKFGVPVEMSREVKIADVVMLEMEWNDLMLGKTPKASSALGYFNQGTAKQKFLEAFYSLMPETTQPNDVKGGEVFSKQPRTVFFILLLIKLLLSLHRATIKFNEKI
jgi:hypothetical protein